MRAIYLRVKKWKDWQHYKDREPPWVKLHSKLLNDSAFLELAEQEQWQLVRIWMVVARSSRFTLDDKGRIVPVIACDETTIRRAIGSLKRVPIRKFIESGWLIEVHERHLVDNPCPNAENERVSEQKTDVTSSDNRDKKSLGTTGEERLNQAKTHEHGDSTVLAPRKPGDSALLEAEKQRSREAERTTSPSRPTSSPDALQGLPIENEFLTLRLLELIRRDADQGTENVIRAHTAKLPPAAIARVIESLNENNPKNRARYAVGALKSEAKEAA